MLTAIRELAEEAERGGDLAAIVARGDDCVARTQRDAARAHRGGRRRRGRGRARRDRARDRGRARPASRCPSAPPERERDARRSRRSTRSSRATATAPSSSSRARASTPTRSRRELEPLGDSLLVVGDPTALKVHVHTDDPGRALSLGVARGDDRRRRDREHARADPQREERLLHAVPGDRRARLRGRRRRRPAPATGGCSRASARASSTAGRR